MSTSTSDVGLEMLEPVSVSYFHQTCASTFFLPSAFFSSDTDSYPGDHRHDDLLEQAELARKAKRRKQDLLQQKYGDIVDDSPAFVNPTREHNLPQSPTNHDRNRQSHSEGSLQLIATTLTELEGPVSFLPLQRVVCRCAHGKLKVDMGMLGSTHLETVFIAIPLLRDYNLGQACLTFFPKMEGKSNT